MKICLINNLYKPYAKGGAERIVEIMAEGLVKDGHEVVIITSRPRGWKLLRPDQAENDRKRSNIYYINSLYHDLDKIPLAARLFWHFWDEVDFVSAFLIRRIIKKVQPDVIVTHNLKGLSFLTPLFVKDLKIKKIHILHDIQLLHPSGLMFFGKEGLLDTILALKYQRINRFLFKNIDIVISPSSWLLELHKKRGYFSNSKQFVLPNPVEVADLSNASKERDDNIFRFLYIGHLSEAKGVPFLMRVFERFLREHRHIKAELILVGSNRLTNKEQEKLKTPFIKVLGFADRYKIEDLLKNSDCLVVPSLCYENSPTVIYEAASFGLPVISSRIGGAEELSERFFGKLFEPANEADLMNNMLWAAQNPLELKTISRLELKMIRSLETNKYLDALIQTIRS